jgi:hypothetical protein
MMPNPADQEQFEREFRESLQAYKDLSAEEWEIIV